MLSLLFVAGTGAGAGAGAEAGANVGAVLLLLPMLVLYFSRSPLLNNYRRILTTSHTIS